MAALTGTLPKNTYGDLIQAGNSGAGVPASLQQIQDGLGNNTGLFLSTTQIGIAANDIGLKRIVAKVASFSDGSTGAGWVQTAGMIALANNFTASDATIANHPTAFSFNVITGRSYMLTGFLYAGNSTAGEGFKFDFNGGAASMTTFVVEAQSVNGTNTPGTLVATSLSGAINWTSLTATNCITIFGMLKPSSTGTLIMRASENTTSTGTLTITAPSWLCLADMPTA